jgi:hypothetical protein
MHHPAVKPSEYFFPPGRQPDRAINFQAKLKDSHRNVRRLDWFKKKLLRSLWLTMVEFKTS